MKVKFLKSLFVIGMLLATGVASAQSFLEDPKYGADPESRKKNVEILNFFNDAVKANNIQVAAGYLKSLLQNAPKSSQNLYISGSNIYKTKIAKATTPEAKKIFIDSLMIIHDLRIEHFGDNAKRGKNYILGLKAQDYFRYCPTDTENQVKLFKEAIAAAGSETDPMVITMYYKVLVDGFMAHTIETDVVIDEYDRLLALLEGEGDPEKTTAKANVDALFAQSGAASCENLERIFKPKYEADPENKELMNKILNLLGRARCTGDFQMILAEKMFKLEPSASGAMNLALAFEGKGDVDKMFSYFDQAISMEKDAALKEKYIIAAAGTALARGNTSKCAQYSKEAIAANGNSGMGYFFLAQAYASGASKACSSFDTQTVYWLVVDNLQRAKELLTNEPTYLEQISKQLSAYPSNFPNKEECFYRQLDNGNRYTVNCGWISGGTVVRTR